MQQMAFFLVLILGFILAEASDRILSVFIPTGPDLAHASAIFRVLGNFVLIVGFTGAISIYIRHVRDIGFTKIRVIVITLCLLWPAIMVVTSFKTYFAWKDFYQYVNTTSAASDGELVNKMNKALTGKKKSRISYLHAQYIYQHEGKITEYQSPEGATVSYTPNSEDEEARGLITYGKAHNSSNKIVAIISSTFYLVSLLSICYFGFLVKAKTPKI
jgi:hypothetical protein